MLNLIKPSHFADHNISFGGLNSRNFVMVSLFVTVNRNQTVVSAQILQSSGAQILVVAFDVTSSAALAELTNVASGPAYVVNVNTAIGIDEQVDSTLSIACQGAQRSG